ncbi:Methyltransferase type 11 [Catenulispora acidiphila DSM 44928]|uniref:Methyltransferase type 11 n=1 Tax=Catenulispora acidiphila (strain DSM 44928 / JCM 14897 / NBRC 102108 / NRRL B-24433 / ID139908) TaxID=479433 RepID=C7Q6F0_CATAD|nr:methyltransferase domain-containing protein [Catenulispora acidiphila]ACU72156.1 Methyltransferase type 11 [Catenulispora acidiphila DSM 44928]
MKADMNTAVERYYDTTLDLYEELWGEHVHHGFWDEGERPDADGADRHRATDRLVHELVSYAGVPDGARVLDVGCGIGGPALYLAGALGCAVVGVTLSASQAARAGEKAQEAGLADRAEFHQLDALSTGFPDASFDVLWAVESLMHIADREAFFAEAMRLLRPGGRLAIATWSQRDGELSQDEQELIDQILKHQVMPSFSSLEEHERMANAAGFTEVASVDWSRAVANSWDPEFALIKKPEHGRATMVSLARERGADVLGFFYAGPLMKKGFDTGVVTYGAIRAVKPVEASRNADTFNEVVELLRVVLDQDAAWSASITPATTLDRDLEMESIELTAWSKVVQARYGAAADLAAHVAGLGVDQIIALTVGDIAAYVNAQADGA